MIYAITCIGVVVTYPNFVREQLFVDMWILASHVELLKANCHAIRKISRRFGRKWAKKTQNGGENINLGGVLQHWAHLGPLGSFNRKQPAHLGELGGNLLPHFSINGRWGAKGKGFSTFSNQISLKISEEKKKERENQHRGTSVMFP